MRVFPRLQLSAEIAARPYEDPLKICESAKALTGASFAVTDREALARIRDFSVPYVSAVDAFNASKLRSATPSSMTPPAPETGIVVTSMLHLITAAELQPLSYHYENGGALAVNLTPQRPNSHDRHGYEKSIKSLRGHTDASFNPSPAEFLAGDTEYSCSPDFVALACIRNPLSVATRLTVLSDIISLLSEEERVELQKPSFILTPQSSFDLPFGVVRFGPVLWRETSGQWCCRFSHSHIVADPSENPGAVAALTQFGSLARNASKLLVISPGEILLFNNRTIVHGREEIAADWDPTARWLLRMYANRPETPANHIYDDRGWILH